MKKPFLCLLGILFSTMGLSSCAPKEEFSFFVASDTHVLSSSLIDGSNKVYRKETIAGDGRMQQWDEDLLSRLVEKANKEKPKVLILTGDLTFDGEKDSHQKVASILASLTSTKALVLPGNHDTYTWFPHSYHQDSLQEAEWTDAESFRSIYASYGYEGAKSYDEESLSYVYSFDGAFDLYLLDSTLNRFNGESGKDRVDGGISPSTFSWLEKQLEKTKEEGKKAIAFSHHNLLTHNPLFEKDYTIANSEALASLFRSYGVKINFSGHLHNQTIAEKEGIYDIASMSLLAPDSSFGKVKLSPTSFRYKAESLLSSEEKEESFAHFSAVHLNKTLSRYQTIYGDQAQAVAEFVSKANAFYFMGQYEIIEQMKLDPLYSLFQEKSEDAYMNSVFAASKGNPRELSLSL